MNETIEGAETHEELRRQHDQLKAERDALLKALKQAETDMTETESYIVNSLGIDFRDIDQSALRRVRAAIIQAEKE